MALSLYIVVAIYSTVYSYRRLHRPGVSAPVRTLFVKKHFLYVVVFIIIWMIQQGSNYFSLFNPPDVTDTTSTINSLPPLYRLGASLGFKQRGVQATSNDSEDDTINPIIIVSGVMTFSTGIFLTFVRMYEPLFRTMICQLIYQFFGDIYQPKLTGASTIDDLKA
jgi:hypothetical protein